MFAERVVGDIRAFRAGPSVSDRGAWDGLPESVRWQLIGDGEAALEAGFPLLLATDYLGYARRGNRVDFEAKYFARRRRLNALILAECVENKGRFLDAIVDGLMLLCEESGWQLPAHNSQERGGPREALSDVDRPVIDLFAAETGALLAVAIQVLEPALENAAPGLPARGRRELEKRIFEPYLGRHFWWMGNGDEPMNNWTIWCTQNVLIAALVCAQATDFRRKVVERASKSVDAFLKDYGDDGACEEGVVYYRHAGLCLFNTLVILEAVAPDAFGPLWAEPKIRNIAEYIVHMHVDGRRYFNFADSAAQVERCGAREFLFGRKVGSDLLADFAAADWQVERHLTLPEEINLFYRIQAAFTVAELERQRPVDLAKPDIYLPSVGLLVARDDQYALAVKAGDNGDSHNHNDVGSVIVYKGGKPVLIDVGVESYTAKTFSPSRYEIWTMQSAWHNLPSFDGVMQQDGERFAARDVQTRLDERGCEIEIELAGAYPAEAGLRSYRRRVRLDKGQDIAIEDTFDGDRAATLSLMFAQLPRLEASRIVLDGLAELRLEGAGEMQLDTIPITDARLRQSWPEKLWRVRVPLVGRRLSITIN